MPTVQVNAVDWVGEAVFISVRATVHHWIDTEKATRFWIVQTDDHKNQPAKGFGRPLLAAKPSVPVGKAVGARGAVLVGIVDEYGAVMSVRLSRVVTSPWRLVRARVLLPL